MWGGFGPKNLTPTCHGTLGKADPGCYGQTDGNPMIEPVRSPALRLSGCMATGHDRRRGYPVAKGDINIPLGLRM